MAYPTWLIPQIDAVPKRDTLWICVCNICHTETDNYLSKAIGKSHAI
jgi:hypothetical protein